MLTGFHQFVSVLYNSFKMASVELEEFQTIGNNSRKFVSNQFANFNRKKMELSANTNPNPYRNLSKLELNHLTFDRRSAELNDFADKKHFLHGPDRNVAFGRDIEQEEPLDFSSKCKKSESQASVFSTESQLTKSKVRNKIEMRLAELRDLNLLKSREVKDSVDPLLMMDQEMTHPRKTNGHHQQRNHHLATMPDLLRIKSNPMNGMISQLTNPYQECRVSANRQYAYNDMESVLNAAAAMNGHQHAFSLSPAVSKALNSQQAIKSYSNSYLPSSNYYNLPQFLSPNSDLVANSNLAGDSMADESYAEFKRQIRHLQQQQQNGLSYGGLKRANENNGALQLNSLLTASLQYSGENIEKQTVQANQHFLDVRKQPPFSKREHRRERPRDVTSAAHLNGSSIEEAMAPQEGDNEAGAKSGDLDLRSRNSTPSSSRSSSPQQSAFSHSKMQQDLTSCVSPSSVMSNDDSINQNQNSCNSENSRLLSLEGDVAVRLQHSTNGHGGTGKKRGRSLPDELKDEAYWERRRKNNEAAKRSRDARRAKEDEIAIRAAFLEQENLKLRVEVASLKSETAKLRCLLYNS